MRAAARETSNTPNPAATKLNESWCESRKSMETVSLDGEPGEFLRLTNRGARSTPGKVALRARMMALSEPCQILPHAIHIFPKLAGLSPKQAIST
jgi:hypothetical protein